MCTDDAGERMRAVRTAGGTSRRLAVLAAILWMTLLAVPLAAGTWQPLATDGLHDPQSTALTALQEPQEALGELPPDSGGNQVDWAAALKQQRISPRSSITARSAPRVLHLDVVLKQQPKAGDVVLSRRNRKWLTPNAVFSHAAHTDWVDCGTCHPAIFKPANGANAMSMAEIMTGKQCGVCHGTVAFPASACKRCHYETRATAARNVSAKVGAPAKPRERRSEPPRSR